MHKYIAFGIGFASELELPGVTKATQCTPITATVQLGTVPESLPAPLVTGPAWGAAPGRFLLNHPDVGRFLVRDGQDITVQPAPGVPASTVRVFLMGSAFGALMHQQQILPLHASAVRVGDVCVAFTGDSGAGKSTIAGYLEQSGYDILSDDTSAIRILPGFGPVVYPGFPRIKLNADSFANIHTGQHNYHSPQNDYEKFELAVERPMTSRFLPLQAVYALQRGPDSNEVSITKIPANLSLRCLVKNTYRRRYLEGFAAQQPHFQTCADILRSTQIFNLHRPVDFTQLPATVARLKSHWAELSHEAALASAG